MKKRWYIHGDENEENNKEYYCAGCDLMMSFNHFRDEDDTWCGKMNHYTKAAEGLETLKNLKKNSPKFKNNYERKISANSKNICL